MFYFSCSIAYLFIKISFCSKLSNYSNILIKKCTSVFLRAGDLALLSCLDTNIFKFQNF